MDRYRWAGRALALGIFLAVIVPYGPLHAFLDVPSIFTAVLGGIAAWGLTSGRNIADMRRTLRSSRPSSSELAKALVTAKAGRRSFWLAGAIGVTIGLVQLFDAFGDWAAFGPAMSVFFLAPLYALLIDIFGTSPLEQRVIAKAQSMGVADRVLDAVADVAPPSRDRQARRRSAQSEQ